MSRKFLQGIFSNETSISSYVVSTKGTVFQESKFKIHEETWRVTGKPTVAGQEASMSLILANILLFSR
jgi:hypothetical protein